MKARDLSATELVKWYLARIEELNPLLGAVIETNPDAVKIAALARHAAARRPSAWPAPWHSGDREGQHRHGRPDGDDGRLPRARRQQRAPRRADRRPPPRRRCHRARQGQPVRVGELPRIRAVQRMERPRWLHPQPVLLDLDPCGSSSGSATVVAANLATLAVGTETDGSILCPAGEQNVVGIKPTIGLVSQAGIIPIAASQDTAGPMARTVLDAAAAAQRVAHAIRRGRRSPSAP